MNIPVAQSAPALTTLSKGVPEQASHATLNEADVSLEAIGRPTSEIVDFAILFSAVPDAAPKATIAQGSVKTSEATPDAAVVSGEGETPAQPSGSTTDRSIVPHDGENAPRSEHKAPYARTSISDYDPQNAAAGQVTPAKSPPPNTDLSAVPLHNQTSYSVQSQMHEKTMPLSRTDVRHEPLDRSEPKGAVHSSQPNIQLGDSRQTVRNEDARFGQMGATALPKTQTIAHVGEYALQAGHRLETSPVLDPNGRARETAEGPPRPTGVLTSHPGIAPTIPATQAQSDSDTAQVISKPNQASTPVPAPRTMADSILPPTTDTRGKSQYPTAEPRNGMPITVDTRAASKQIGNLSDMPQTAKTSPSLTFQKLDAPVLPAATSAHSTLAIPFQEPVRSNGRIPESSNASSQTGAANDEATTAATHPQRLKGATLLTRSHIATSEASRTPKTEALPSVATSIVAERSAPSVDHDVLFTRATSSGTPIPMVRSTDDFYRNPLPTKQLFLDAVTAGGGQSSSDSGVLDGIQNLSGRKNEIAQDGTRSPIDVKNRTGMDGVQLPKDDTAIEHQVFRRADDTPTRREQYSALSMPPTAQAPQPGQMAMPYTAKPPVLTSAKNATGGLMAEMQSKVDSAHSLLIASDSPEIVSWDAGRTSMTSHSATAPLRSDLAPHVARQLVEVMVQAANRPTEIALSPQELGRVRMSVVTEDGAITVNILTERPETLELMRRHIDQLGQTFRSMGYESISFAFGQGTDSGEQTGAGPDDGTTHDRNGTSRADGSAQTDAPDIIHLNAAPMRGLDIRL